MMRWLFPLVIGLVGTGILIGLGTWQVQRLGWKEALLASIDAQIGADPAPIPDVPDPQRDRFLPVTATGHLNGDPSINILASLKVVGPVHRRVAVLSVDERRVLVDLGTTSVNSTPEPIPAVPVTITGNLDWPDEIDSFTPEPDLEANLWFARDVARMANVLDTEPVLIVARTVEPALSGITPHPVNSDGIPNDHLEYAITWFSLAAIWIGMTGFWVWRNRA